MRKSGNGLPEICAANLLRIVRGEVPYDRVRGRDGALVDQPNATDEAVADDAAAWYLSFTPGNQYYQLRNAKTGYYMTYTSGFATARHTTPTSADNIHLMRGRVDVVGHRGYYFIHPESSSNPPTLTGNADGATNFPGV